MLRRAVLFTAIVLLPAACSGDDQPAAQNAKPTTSIITDIQGTDSLDDDGGSTPALTSSRAGCTVRITGSITTQFTSPDEDASFTSDYYLSQDQIDAGNPLLTGESDAVTVESTIADEEPDLTTRPRPPGAAPQYSWFLMSCQGVDITLSFYANVDATRDDVPMGSGRYPLTGELESPDPTAFSTSIAFGANPDPEVYEVEDGGHIQIDEFDASGTKGSFEVSMKETSAGKELKIAGEFDVSCHAGDLCQAVSG